jgi:hypothetical protein
MEICVSLLDATSAEGLRERLVGLFGATTVSLDARRGEIRVHAEPGSQGGADRSVIRTISAVQAWLLDHSLNSAQLRLGTQSFMLHGADRRPSFAPPSEFDHLERHS